MKKRVISPWHRGVIGVYIITQHTKELAMFTLYMILALATYCAGACTMLVSFAYWGSR